MPIKIKIIFFLLIFMNLITGAARSQIVYINMEKLFKESMAGISLNKEISKINNFNEKNIKKIETEIKSEDENINSQKNILNEEELKKKIAILNNKIKEYQKLIKKNKNNLNKKKVEGTNIILNTLKPILSEYSEKNSISMVLQKQNVIIGKKELDITEDIILILNEKIKKIDIN
tara:strand:+ start:240 stop:764 length:525 start_codon:yes stop_codon:yes gene_type:complete